MLAKSRLKIKYVKLYDRYFVMRDRRIERTFATEEEAEKYIKSLAK